MEVFIPAGSPLFSYAPCTACDPSTGWQAFATFDNSDFNGTDSGMVTTYDQASASISFIGTSVYFNVSYGDGGAGWTSAVTVNGSTPASDYNTTATGIEGLPRGEHNVTLTFSQEGSASAQSWARVDGFTGIMGQRADGTSQKTQLDDTQIAFNGRWEFMDDGTIPTNGNSALFHDEYATRARNWNSSLSWTTSGDSTMEAYFEGSAVWVLGLGGEYAGYSGNGGPKVYNQTLFFASGLSSDVHKIMMTRVDGELAIDSIISWTGLIDVDSAVYATTPPGPLATQSAQDAAPTAASRGSNNLPTGTVIGAAVGGVAGFLLLTALAGLCWARSRKKKAGPGVWGTDRKPWYKRMFKEDKGWRFETIEDEHQRPMSELRSTPNSRSTGTRDPNYVISGSSFGSAGMIPSLPPLALDTNAPRLSFGQGAHIDRGGSPDPMAAALGGATSPLAQLQNSWYVPHGGAGGAAGAAGFGAAGAVAGAGMGHAPPPGVRFDESRNHPQRPMRPLPPGSAPPPSAFSAPPPSSFPPPQPASQAGDFLNVPDNGSRRSSRSSNGTTSQWYHWFGLSQYGARMSRSSLVGVKDLDPDADEELDVPTTRARANDIGLAISSPSDVYALPTRDGRERVQRDNDGYGHHGPSALGRDPTLADKRKTSNTTGSWRYQ